MNVPDPFSPLETPESQGLDSSALARTLDGIRDEGVSIDSVLVARNGRIVLDAYRYPYRAGIRHDMASVTKSVTALVVGAALADRACFGMNEPLTADGAMTVGDALSMTTGLACGLIPGEAAQFREMQATSDWARYVEDLPRLQPAGTHFSYCSPGYHLVSAYISRTTGESLETNAARLLFAPLGITDWHWRTDPLGRTVGWGDLGLHPRDAARIGQMILDGGRFQNRQVIPEDWIETAARERIKTGQRDEAYGYGFWRPPGQTHLIALEGRGGQLVALNPAEGLMVVVTGTGYPASAIASLFSSLVVSAGPVSENLAARTDLARATRLFAAPPTAGAVTQPGETARALLGATLDVVEPNALGLRTLSVSQSGGEGLFTGALMGVDVEAPVGFDGVARLGGNGMRGMPMVASGHWTAPNRLRLEVTSFGVAVRFIFDLQFRADGTVGIGLTEGTGFFSFQATAVRRPSPT
jgi:CubicO group peptidase (beta-lactamase class C family)